MRAYDKKKIVRQFWSREMQAGRTNDASSGNWGNYAPATTAGHNKSGSTSANKKSRRG